MHGIIQNHNHVHKRTVAVTPIVHSYHAPGETPYQKFNCPVCNALGNTKIGLPHGVKQCPLCGVHLERVRQPQVGDEIIITESVEGEPELTVGTKAVIQKIVESADAYEIRTDIYKIRTETTPDRCRIPRHAFSILEDVI